MKKLVVSALAVMVWASSAIAQQITETTASFNKEEKPAVALTMEFSKKMMDEAVTNHFKADKQKAKAANGMMLYQKMTYAGLCVKDCDVYTKIDGSNKNSTLYIFIQRENGNFVVPGDNEIPCIKDFLKKISAEVVALDLQYQIEEQTKVYEKAVKEYDKLVSKKEDLQKELRNTEKEIAEADSNKKEQKAILDQLKSKVKK